jgi:uncharacterized repeat protein (TIGR03843 family)
VTTPTAADVRSALRDGSLEVIGRLIGSSNNAMVVRVGAPSGSQAGAGAGSVADPNAATRPDAELLAVWKPTRGERPLFDFPIGTLTRREVAAYAVSEAIGWGIVPPTLLRDGPFGEGMIQQWIDVDLDVDIVAALVGDDPRLRRIAVFDAVINNTDRKGGHLLPVAGGHLYAVDHGVTFSAEPKLRTLLWAWEGEPFDAEERAGLERVRMGLDSGAVSRDLREGALVRQLRELLAGPEIDATRARVEALISSGVFPSPSPDWPAIPWPPI